MNKISLRVQIGGIFIFIVVLIVCGFIYKYLHAFYLSNFGAVFTDFFYNFLLNFLSGFSVYFLSKKYRWWNILCFSLIIFVGNLSISYVLQQTQVTEQILVKVNEGLPYWYIIISFFAVIPQILLGGLFAALILKCLIERKSPPYNLR